MKPFVGDLVDGGGVRVARMVADAKGGVGEERPSLAALNAEDHAELAVWVRQVDLDAMRELCPVDAFVVAREKMIDGHAVLLVLISGGSRDLAASIAGTVQVLGEGGIIK